MQQIGEIDNNNIDDGINPFGVTDFRVTTYTESSATLKWTASGDDSTAGTADRYDLRYFKHAITSANWDSAIQVTGLPHPKPSGQTDSMLVRGLLEDSTYYFSIMAYDEANNPSPRSGNVTVTCFNNYVVTIADSNLEAVIRQQLMIPVGNLYRMDMRSLSTLDGNNRNITLLNGLEECINMVSASFVSDHISDLSPLSHLNLLQMLGLTNNGIEDISAISGLTNMWLLQLRTNHVVDISTLSNMNRLHLLDLTQNQIADLSPLVADTGFATGDTVWITENPLSAQSINTYIPQLQARGAAVIQ
jgi:hypothetical protein